jgi:hypothetical protein
MIIKKAAYRNVWDTEKALLRGKFRAIIANIKERKPETSQVNNLIMHLKLLEKQEQMKPKTSRWREII